MIIRSEQLATFDDVMQQRYCDELRKLLREKFPQLVQRLDDQMLFDRIVAAVKSARAFGVRTGEGILGYVGLAIAAGPAFNQNVKVRRFFEYPGDDDVDQRVRWLFTRVTEKLQGVLKKPETAE
jgi:hypothetical protein